MSTISSVASTLNATTSTTSTTSTSSKDDEMGKTDFLKLLVAQLQSQDPLNPQDPTEFTAQLAQYSSLEQLMNVNDNLTSMSSTFASGTRSNAAAYIGRTATVSGDQVTLSGGAASTVQFDLEGAASTVSVDVYDSTGSLVDVVSMGELGSGLHDFTWDGKTASGTTAADGTYTFKVVASDSDGNGIDATTRFSGTVDSISFENGNTMLNIGGSSWSLDDVLAIGAAN